jgi:hypothetical protein
VGTVTLTLEEYTRLVQMANSVPQNAAAIALLDSTPAPKRRKTSAYNRRYKAAFKKVAPRYKLKNGNWKSNGFRSAVRAAHKVAKK